VAAKVVLATKRDNSRGQTQEGNRGYEKSGENSPFGLKAYDGTPGHEACAPKGQFQFADTKTSPKG